MKTYRELTEDQREQADKIPYLLGSAIDEPIFDVRGGQIYCVHTMLRSHFYAGDWGYFCYECRQAIPASTSHIVCSQSFIYPVHTREDAEKLVSLKTLREQLENEE